MIGLVGGAPTMAEPVSSHVDEVGQAMDVRLVEVVPRGSNGVQVSWRGDDWPTAPARRTGPADVVPRA